jgi:hypothetical protein
MTDTHAKRIAFHLEGMLLAINPANPRPVADAVANAVATAYHADGSTHAQRVAFALAMLAGASAALQQVEAETGGLVEKARTDASRFRLLGIRDAADATDVAVMKAAGFYASQAERIA